MSDEQECSSTWLIKQGSLSASTHLDSRATRKSHWKRFVENANYLYKLARKFIVLRLKGVTVVANVDSAVDNEDRWNESDIR